MTLQTFCDIVWQEIWDDVGPMGDQSLYRDIVIKLFIDGMEPHQITWKDHEGKTQRLSDSNKGGSTSGPSKSQMDTARALHERLREAKAAAKEAKRVASPPDG